MPALRFFIQIEIQTCPCLHIYFSYILRSSLDTGGALETSKCWWEVCMVNLWILDFPHLPIQMVNHIQISGLHHLPSAKFQMPRQPQPRLAAKSLLDGVYGEVMGTYGVCCSSWVATSRGSTKRSFLTPMGCCEYQSVSLANKMVSRFFYCTMGLRRSYDCVDRRIYRYVGLYLGFSLGNSYQAQLC